MEKGILGILDFDEEYAYHLMNYINRKEECLLTARMFTNIESIEEFLEKHMIEVLLFGEYSFKNKLEKYHSKTIKYIFYLSNSSMVREEESIASIYKYQSTESLIKEVMSYYLDQADPMCNIRHDKNTKKKMISVYSPCGGSGKTTTAFLLGLLYGETSRVLIVNLETISGTYCNIPPNGEHGGLSDFIYYVKERKKNISYKLSTMIVKIDKVDYLLPVDHYEDLYQLETTDVQLLLDVLTEDSDYDYIIFDIGLMNKSMERIMEASERIYMPILSHVSCQDKWNYFIKILKLDQCIHVKDRIIELKLPYDPLLKEDPIKWEQIKKGELASYIRRKII